MDDNRDFGKDPIMSEADWTNDEYLANIAADELRKALEAGWTWLMHPHMRGRSVGWHVAADMPHADANAVTAALNSLRDGGTA